MKSKITLFIIFGFMLLNACNDKIVSKNKEKVPNLSPKIVDKIDIERDTYNKRKYQERVAHWKKRYRECGIKYNIECYERSNKDESCSISTDYTYIELGNDNNFLYEKYCIFSQKKYNISCNYSYSNNTIYTKNYITAIIKYTFVNDKSVKNNSVGIGCEFTTDPKDECHVMLDNMSNNKEIDSFLKTWGTKRLDKVEIWDSIYEAKHKRK